MANEKICVVSILMLILFSGCIEKKNYDQKKSFTDALDMDSSMTVYFGKFSKFRSNKIEIDTMTLFKRKINDSIFEFRYLDKSQLSQINLIPFQLNHPGLPFPYSYLADFSITTEFLIIPEGDTIHLYELRPKEPSTDGAFVAVINEQLGMILSYSPSWGNYYYFLGSDNPKIDSKILKIQTLYLMKKTFLTSFKDNLAEGLKSG